jgi:hypothetical protein
MVEITNDLKTRIETIANQRYMDYYTVKVDTIVDGKRVKYVVYANKRLVGGISQETYEAHKEYIDNAMSNAARKANDRALRESWEVKALTGNIITKVTKGEDFDLYALTATLPTQIWAKIKHLTQYIKSDEDMEGGCDFGGENYKGWTIASGADKLLIEIAEKTANPAQREMVKTILAEKDEAKKAAEVRKQEKQEKQQTLNEVLVAFENAEYPEGNFNPEGERIEDPFYPLDIYGGGRFFIVGKEEIWFVKNNGHDGDDWSRNNIQTGGAGGIGTRIEYTADIAEKIRLLVR